jgi:hypothetical protein
MLRDHSREHNRTRLPMTMYGTPPETIPTTSSPTPAVSHRPATKAAGRGPIVARRRGVFVVMMVSGLPALRQAIRQRGGIWPDYGFAGVVRGSQRSDRGVLARCAARIAQQTRKETRDDRP